MWKQRSQNENHPGHLPTHLKGLDAVLCGGIPTGVLTELVGPAGIGKTQVLELTLFDLYHTSTLVVSLLIYLLVVYNSFYYLQMPVRHLSLS